MSILGFKTPEFVVLRKNGESVVLHLNADQRSQYERFCNDLLQRVSVTVIEAMWKANDYIAHGLNGVELNETWGQTYHDLILLFPPEESNRLLPPTQEQIDWWDPLKDITPNEKEADPPTAETEQAGN